MNEQNEDSLKNLINKSANISLFINFSIIIVLVFASKQMLNDKHNTNNLNNSFEDNFPNFINEDILSLNKSKSESQVRQLAEDYSNTYNFNTENLFVTDTADIKKRKFIEKLINHSFSGRWKTKSKIFDFENKEGLFRLFFQNYMMRGPKGSYYNFILFFHDGETKDRWIFMQNSFPISFNDNSTFANNYNETTLTHNNVQILLSELQMFDVEMKKYEWVDFKLTSNLAQISGYVRNTINPEVEITFEIIIEPISLYNKISNFSMILSIFASIQLLNSKYLMDRFADNEMQSLKYSHLVFLINILFNGFICFTNFVISLYDDRLFNDFIVPTVIYFLNFSYFELRIILYIWRAQIFRGESSEFQYSNAETRFKNKLLRLYVFLYVSMLLIYVYGPQIFFWKTFIYISVSLTWLPQIWLNFKKGRKNFIPFITIIVISLNKIYVPLYFRLCPKNFLDLPVDNLLCINICVIIFLQILVLFLQRILGLRCLVPKCMLPKRYNYEKTFKELQKLHIDLDNMACSICLGIFGTVKEDKSIDPSKQNTSNANKTDTDIQVITSRADLEKQVVKRLSLCKKIKKLMTWCAGCFDRCVKKCNRENFGDEAYMYTPCHHLFHAECLKAWMEIKTSCPECRTALPNEREMSGVNPARNVNPNLNMQV